MSLRSRRGSVLIHVLMTGVVVSIVAAGVLRLTMLRYLAAQRSTTGAQNRKQTEALLHRAISHWNAVNTVCSNIGSISCTPLSSTPPGACNCVCPPSGYPRIVVTSGTGTQCKVSIESQDPLPYNQ